MTATQKMAVLRKCLEPNVQDALGDCLNDPALYEEALVELATSFGHFHLISRVYLRTILGLPRVSHLNDYPALLSFSSALRGAAASLRNGGYEAELTTGSLLELVLDKLPGEIQSRWGKKIVKSYPECLTLREFVPWLHTIVKAEMVVKHSKLTQLPPNTKQDRKQGRQAGSKPGQSQSPSVLATTVTPNQNAPDKPSKREI